jgi:tryptophan-rich sensory protein
MSSLLVIAEGAIYGTRGKKRKRVSVKGYNASVKSALIAGAFCVFGMLVEGLCAGKSTGAVMKSLRQPRWALPMAAWYVLGFAYYAVCFTTVYRLGVVGGRVALLIVIGLLMLANAMWNALFFRMRDLKLSLLFYIPYSVLVMGLIVGLWSVDRLSAWLFIAYACYLPYALAWSYAVMKDNEP